jgi:hypothetical protein
VESYREKQRLLLQSLLKGRRLFAFANFRSRDRAAGYWLYQCEPTALERLWFGAVTLHNRIQSKLRRMTKSDPSPK